MSENAQKPRIRFKGFSDAWEQRKLGELSNIIDPHPSHRAPEEEEIGIPFVGIGDVDIDGNINYEKVRKVNESIYDEHHRRYDLAIPSLGIGRVASLGKVIRLRDDIGKYAVSPTMSIMQFTENSNIDFLYAAMNTEMFQRQFALQSNGSTRQSVGIQDLRVTEVSISPNGEEQKEIGAYFRNLDNLITLHQRKYDKLVAVKKALLEKMFPADGETVPKIRFKGFSDAWEQRKLGDTVQITMGQSPDGSTYSDVPSDYILVQGNADLQNGWVSPRLWTSQMTKKADAGDLIMSVRAPAGAMGKTAYNAVIGRGVAAIKGNEFIYQLLVKMDSDGYWKALSCGSTFESLNSDNIKNADVLIPNAAEQKKIGQYFANLDNLITLHQRQLEKLKNIKSALLEKMFV